MAIDSKSATNVKQSFMHESPANKQRTGSGAPAPSPKVPVGYLGVGYWPHINNIKVLFNVSLHLLINKNRSNKNDRPKPRNEEPELRMKIAKVSMLPGSVPWRQPS